MTLHVRAHESTVRVVVLKERDASGRDGNDLLWRNVNIRDAALIDADIVFIMTANDFVLENLLDEDFFAIDCDFDRVTQADVGLGDILPSLIIGAQIFGFVRDIIMAILMNYYAIWGLDEAVIIDAGIGAEVIDKTDVLSFWRFDRANTAIMRIVNVADFHGDAFSR